MGLIDSAKSRMCLWSLMVATGVALIFLIGLMLFYSPGRSNGVSHEAGHALHAPR